MEIIASQKFHPSLLKLLLGQLEPDAGSLRLAKNLDIAYLDYGAPDGWPCVVGTSPASSRVSRSPTSSTPASCISASAAGISAIPTLMLFRDGVLLFRESGALPPA